MKLSTLAFTLLLCVATTAFAAAEGGMRRWRAMEWNCENLYDTLHDSRCDDSEFLPESERAWNAGRYWKKQSDLARTILEAGGLQPVDAVALCEVENDSVVYDLTHRTRLAALGYDYVVTESDDQRGIDVALIYQPATFRLIAHSSHRVPYDATKDRPTRDVLLCTGVIPTGDTLDIAVVHFPSRRGGQLASEHYRQRAASVVAGLADSLRRVRPGGTLIVMGDCNDEPRDASLRRMAAEGLDILTQHPRHAAGIDGTYYYRGEWSQIDNILVSHDGVSRYGIEAASIFTPYYILEENASGFPVPWRTYRGSAYHGGVSDHLPLLLDLWY